MTKLNIRRIMFVATCAFAALLINRNVKFIKSKHRSLKIDFHRRAFSAEKSDMFQTTTSLIKPPGKTYECEVFDLGCFPIKTSSGIRVTQVSNLDECFKACGLGFVAITNSTKCVCMATKFVEIRNISSESCNLPCQHQPKRKCGGRNVANLYRVASDCVKVPFSSDFVETRRIGCFRQPSRDAGFITIQASSSSECLLMCGRFQDPIAAFNGKTCRCGKMTDRFNLTHVVQFCYKNATPIYRTLVEDRRCSVQLLPTGKMKTTTLTSRPGSGNTWVRYLLEKATGFYTGSVYTDLSLQNSGFLCESLDQLESVNCPVVKDHIFSKGTEFDQTIELIRNPYDTILANTHRMYTMDHTGSINETILRGVLDERVKDRIKPWRIQIGRVLMETKPLLIVYYEDLVKDPLQEVERMVRFLPKKQHPQNLMQRLSCLSQEITGFNKRKKVPLKFDPLSVETKRFVDKAIDIVRRTMKKKGIKQLLPNYNKL